MRKREGFRAAFCGFDFNALTKFTPRDIDRLVLDPGIIRHRGKIEATLNNAHRAQELVDEFGSLANFFWEFAANEPCTTSQIPATTEASHALSHELRHRWWKFVGPTTMYALMQAMGLVNDHLVGCVAREACEVERRDVLFPR